MATVTWSSPIPKECQICCSKITDEFIDGKLAHRGTWAIMCPACHRIYGAGFGVGKGQHFVKGENNLFIKKHGMR